jgi:N-acetylglucosaminyldiphosphoundecaprenol N-acetyl-beta-D-mannosaminyltransferase
MSITEEPECISTNESLDLEVPGEDRRPRMFGRVPVDPITQNEAVSRIMTALNEGRGGIVVTPNVDQLAQSAKQPALYQFFERASLVLADGAPLVLAARLAQCPLPERVTGADLLWALTEAAASREDGGVFLLGGAPGAADRAADRVVERFPTLRRPGAHCPPLGFEPDPDEFAAMVSAIRAYQPEIVFCGLGFPKQEGLATALSRVFPDVWFVGCGGAIAFAAGDVSRAPRWMRENGIEWLHRLVMEPRRLASRYLGRDLPFAIGMMIGAMLRRSPALAGPRSAG